jgi:hypothetical protein
MNEILKDREFNKAQTKNLNFYFTPERRGASYTSETCGESLDPLLNTRRFFQQTGIARQCTFNFISWLNVEKGTFRTPKTLTNMNQHDIIDQYNLAAI